MCFANKKVLNPTDLLFSTPARRRPVIVPGAKRMARSLPFPDCRPAGFASIPRQAPEAATARALDIVGRETARPRGGAGPTFRDSR
jgi:hypothetical protein